MLAPTLLTSRPARRLDHRQHQIRIADMKKPTLRIEEQQPRNIQRADIVPTIGYAMVVDGHFKTQFSDESAAKKAAKELLSNYPMLQIEIYDATAKTRR
jgi:hypothetical protein